jgi:hypothetical protein
MRAKLDWSNPSKMVLDTGRGGCRHTLKVDATGEEQTLLSRRPSSCYRSRRASSACHRDIPRRDSTRLNN